MENGIKNGEHKVIWQKLKDLEKYLVNHLTSRMDKIEKKVDRIIWVILGSIVAPVVVFIILNLLGIIR